LDTALRTKSIGAAVAELVREAILCGEFAEGERLPENDLRSKVWTEQNSAVGGSAAQCRIGFQPVSWLDPSTIRLLLISAESLARSLQDTG
jgi:hypothetical protein